jgi:hypothetical protein
MSKLNALSSPLVASHAAKIPKELYPPALSGNAILSHRRRSNGEKVGKLHFPISLLHDPKFRQSSGTDRRRNNSVALKVGLRDSRLQSSEGSYSLFHETVGSKQKFLLWIDRVTARGW